MSSNACKSVGIVGAGIQGVCIGLQLLKKNIPATINACHVLNTNKMKNIVNDKYKNIDKKITDNILYL